MASRGQRVRLIYCSDPYTRLQPGEEGTVTRVDEVGTLHVRWDSGSALGLIPGEDSWDEIGQVSHLVTGIILRVLLAMAAWVVAALIFTAAVGSGEMTWTRGLLVFLSLTLGVMVLPPRWRS